MLIRGLLIQRSPADFAGILSTLPFNIVDITFDSTHALAFAVDNFVVAPTSVATTPEAETLSLVVTGIVAVAAVRRRLSAI